MWYLQCTVCGSGRRTNPNPNKHTCRFVTIVTIVTYICMYRHTVACHTHDRFFDVTICVRMDMLSSYRDAQERLSLNKRCVMRAVHEWASRGHQFCDHGLTCDDRWSFSAHPSIHPKVIQNPSINLPTHSSVLIPWIDDKHCSLAL